MWNINRALRRNVPFLLFPKLFFQVAQACDAKEGVSLKTERFLSRNWNHIFASAASDNLRYFRIKHQNTGGEEGRCVFHWLRTEEIVSLCISLQSMYCCLFAVQCRWRGPVLAEWLKALWRRYNLRILLSFDEEERKKIQFMLETVFNKKSILAFKMRKRISISESCVRTRTFSFGLKLNFQREWEFSLVSD